MTWYLIALGLLLLYMSIQIERNYTIKDDEVVKGYDFAVDGVGVIASLTLLALGLKLVTI